MLTLQEISDRLEIQDLMVDYASAIDQKKFDELDNVFTADAYIDYRSLGGIDGRFPEVKAWLSQVLPNFPMYYHMIGNASIKISGDTAQSRIICFNPMVVNLADGTNQVMYVGLWYRDKFVRTAQGWRMCERIEEKCFASNAPEGLNTGE
ncbi:MAG TPA: nuclear transport factor 2 family protein [Spongiibacteraceae bacterium]|jgi:3-phenylpropionate/cinnamic acid dioxygenase small subunit